jgi:hypothetical protein
VAARVAVKTGKSRGQTPAREELSKLALNESRQAFLLAQRGCLCAKRLKMITNDVIENIDDSARFTAARSAATRGSGASAELSPSAGSAFAFLISNMPYPTT